MADLDGSGLKDRALKAALANLAQSLANLERMSRAGAESAEAIRDIPSPEKTKFWVRLLELTTPKPPFGSAHKSKGQEVDAPPFTVARAQTTMRARQGHGGGRI